MFLKNKRWKLPLVECYSTQVKHFIVKIA